MIKNIFQVLITDSNQGSIEGNSLFEENVSSYRSVYKQANYFLYTGTDLRKFIKERFSSRELRAYDKLSAYAAKADFARYCLLYELGGLYSDLSYLHLEPIALAGHERMVIFKDMNAGSYVPDWSLSNALIFSKPRSEELKAAIVRVVENYEKNFYGKNEVEPTGPDLLGQCLRHAWPNPEIVVGDTCNLTPAQGKKGFYKVMPSGVRVAYRNKVKNSTISELVPQGGNNFGDLWRGKRFWGELGDYRLYTPEDYQLRLLNGSYRTKSAVVMPQGFSGTRLRSPQLSLESGSYILKARMIRDAKSTNCRLTLRTASPMKVLRRRLFAFPFTKREITVSINFHLPKYTTGLQLVLRAGKGFSGKFLWLSLDGSQ